MTMLSIVLLGVGLLVGWIANGCWSAHVPGHALQVYLKAEGTPAQFQERRAIERAVVSPRHLPIMPSDLTEVISVSIPRAATVSDRERADLDTGWALIRSGDYHGAIRALNKAKGTLPDDPRLSSSFASRPKKPNGPEPGRSETSRTPRKPWTGC